MAKSKRGVRSTPAAASTYAASHTSPLSLLLKYALPLSACFLVYWFEPFSSSPPPIPTSEKSPDGMNLSQCALPYDRVCSMDSAFIPDSFCGWAIHDEIVSADEANQLLSMGEKYISITGGGSGPPSIFALDTGALSSDSVFVNSFMKETPIAAERDLIKRILVRLKGVVLEQFPALADSAIHVSSPVFFAQLDSSKEAKTMNDEYWHYHLDIAQYGHFHFTTLVYLSDYGVDFDGGLFEFGVAGTESSEGDYEHREYVEPQKGRVLMFTSGPEHPHRVQPVTRGKRWTLTLAFTCTEDAAVTSLLKEKFVLA
eukprot:TRINITY_DN11297_c0_g1_i1.p1 TRINITY_DN11297_c0_g1~~TRINITY_DN11297_c0_g1_i1.p1  ORF type:complete len:313 (-),score=70.33 TRINITY_DN11297_c0_g1_i1:52-990(-)